MVGRTPLLNATHTQTPPSSSTPPSSPVVSPVCNWELPVLSFLPGTTSTSVLLGATARRHAYIYAEISADGAEELTAEVAPLQTDSTSITVEHVLTAQETLTVFTRHSHPLQTAGAVECIAADLQQVGQSLFSCVVACPRQW